MVAAAAPFLVDELVGEHLVAPPTVAPAVDPDEVGRVAEAVGAVELGPYELRVRPGAEGAPRVPSGLRHAD